VDLPTHQVVESFPAGVQNVSAIAVSPYGLIATGGCTAWEDSSELSDGSQTICTQAEISLWDADTHQKLDVNLDPFEADITDLDFSPDGAYLAAGARDGSIGVWNTSDWTFANSFYYAITDEYYQDILAVYGVTFSPDSSLLLIGVCRSGGYYETCRNGEVRSIDLTTSSTEEPLRRNGIHPGKLVFGPEDDSGAQMAATLDCTEIINDSCVYSVTLWSGDGTDVLPMSNLNLQPSYVLSSLVLAPDGKTLLTGNYTGLLTWWDVDPQSWREKACQIAGRNLTDNEVSQYKANSDACSQWPQEETINP
jgi:WD40 repeat protein